MSWIWRYGDAVVKLLSAERKWFLILSMKTKCVCLVREEIDHIPAINVNFHFWSEIWLDITIIFSESSGGESWASFVFSSCPFIKKRKPDRRVFFADSDTEFLVPYQQPPLPRAEEEHVYEEPDRGKKWPRNKHFFSRFIWQSLKR